MVGIGVGEKGAECSMQAMAVAMMTTWWWEGKDKGHEDGLLPSLNMYVPT